MESNLSTFDKCLNCQNFYNLENRKPVNIQECGETLCETCYKQLLEPQENIFKCPFDKTDHKHLSDKIIYNMPILRKLKERMIYCKIHPEEKAALYSHTMKKLICYKCFSQNQKHYENLQEIDGNEIIKEMSIIIEITEQVYNEIEKEKQKLKKIQEIALDFKNFASKIQSQELTINSEEFMSKLTTLQQFYEQNSKEQFSSDYFNSSKFFQDYCRPIKMISKQDYSLIKNWMPFNFKLKLIFSSDLDGFTAEAFHKKCDNQGPTLSLIKAENDVVIGGYASQSWNSSNTNISQADGSFIFTLHPDHKTKHTIYQNQSQALFGSSSYLMVFGGGCDLYLSDQCNESNNNGTNLGNTYSLPSGTVYGQGNAQTYLVGTFYFKVKEIEVYKVTKI